jgi:hypothetical protein
MDESRTEAREAKKGQYSLMWRGPEGTVHSTEATGIDVSASGIGVESPTPLKTGCIVQVRASAGSVVGEYEVVYCRPRGAKYHIGLEQRPDTAQQTRTKAATSASGEPEPDHYEALQISRNADGQTIHRVFRIMAARFHPDNPETGDVNQFLRMKRAYGVLSDPDRRREYDALLESRREEGPKPVFASKEFVTGMEAEANRRLGVLCLLYAKRQTDPDHPAISLLDLEREMGFPREYLNFTMWYLRSKEYTLLADNSDYVITAAGADYVEKKASRNGIVDRLLKPGSARAGTTGTAARGSAVSPGRRLLV